jgi:hypothetical protein
MLKCESISRKI